MATEVKVNFNTDPIITVSINESSNVIIMVLQSLIPTVIMTPFMLLLIFILSNREAW